jgi:hypothetical protein
VPEDDFFRIDYLTQLLVNLPALHISQLPVWLPDQWKIHHAAQLESLQKPVRPPA